jgi:hypothetical protein
MSDRFGGATRRRPFPAPAVLKESLRRFAPAQALWSALRERQVEREYHERREAYDRIARQRGLVYSAERTRRDVRERLAARGGIPTRRKPGEIHTFALFSSFGWHRHLLPDLRELGPVTHFDYQDLGYTFEQFARGDAAAVASRAEMTSRILPALRAAHAARPVDWIFAYAGGQELSPEVIRTIHSELGIPTVNMSLDDKQGWAGASAGAWRSGAADITSAFDLYMTSARVACEWHMVEGGRPLYLPEGFDAHAFGPRDVAAGLPVSFVGVAYGFRTSVDRFLRKHGVPFHPFGTGWPAGRADDIVDVFNRSAINLGMGGVEYSEELTNVKGRDFEVPGTGGGVYLTSYNADLAQHFTIGEEILCYRGRDEMLELIRHYLRRPEDARAIARRGRERALREHRWRNRFETLLECLGVLGEPQTEKAP